METLINILGALLPILYGVAFSFYFAYFFWQHRAANLLATPSLVVTACCHLFYSILRSAVYHHHPIAGACELMSIVALSLTLVYIAIERWQRDKSTGLFVLPFVFALQLISSICIEPTWNINPLFRNTWFGIHTGTATLAYAALFLSAIYSVMYLVLQRALRKKIFGRIFERLPSLNMLFRMTYGSALVGFAFLTMSIFSGSFWAHAAIQGNFWLDPKVLATLIVWVIFGLALLSRYALKWSGRLLVTILLLSFLLLLLSIAMVRLFPLGWHRFQG